MAEDLKKQTTSSILWNAFDKVGFQVIAFLIGLVTLRLLSPEDFGLIGALAIFTVLSNILVESGFTAAMVRRANNNDAEYVAVLCFNVLLSVVFYLLLYITAPQIATYYNMPELTQLARALFSTILLNSFSIVQNIILTKKLAFKQMSVANMTGALISGVATILMILKGFGYWALAWQIILQTGIKTLMLWVLSSWRPNCKPDFKVIKELFAFSFSLIASSLLNTFVRYIYNPIIGKYFGKEQLGYYSEAYKFFFLPHSIVSNTFTGVAYPVLTRLNDEPNRQMLYLRKMMRMTAFCIFPIMMGASACFGNLVLIALTEKWLPIVPYFQILTLAGVVTPMHNMNLQLMNVKGHPRKNFRLELFRNGMILLTLFFLSEKIEWMLWGFTGATLASYAIDLIVVKQVTGYKIREQLGDIAPYALLSFGMAFCVYCVGEINLGLYPKTALQIATGILIYILPLHILGSQVLKDVLGVILGKKGKEDSQQI